MARRIGLPEHIRVELPQRCRAGYGHDWDVPVGDRDARTAIMQPPTEDMLRLVRQVKDHAISRGALHVTVQNAPRAADGSLGAVQVLWTGGEGPSALSVAQQFAVSHTEDGTPRVPAWLSLVADGDFDLRWQYPL